ncbi:MAG: hypothetical protein AB1631_30830 [Acidobacteriota bacterium]
MPGDRAKLRGTVLAEDRRHERFFRELLVHLGFNINKLTFRTAPSGRGDAKAWVRAQYPHEAGLLRRKIYQQLFLVAVRDGDNDGVTERKADLDDALRESGLNPRQKDERIATPVPTWSIETWMLALLGDHTVDESVSRKQDFEHRYPGREERQALRDAAQAWRDEADRIPPLPSLADGKSEMNRIDFAG